MPRGTARSRSFASRRHRVSSLAVPQSQQTTNTRARRVAQTRAMGHVTLPPRWWRRTAGGRVQAYMGAPIQRVTVPSWERRGAPQVHVAYAVRVEMPVQVWTVYRRYSEFVALDAALPSPPPVALPAKHAVSQALSAVRGLGGLLGGSERQLRAEEELASERQTGLEQYLRAIVCAEDSRWREADAFVRFLELPRNYRPADSATKRGAAAPASLRHSAPRTRPGAAAASSQQAPPAPRETSETRPLSNSELLDHQRDSMMNAQDAQAERLAATLRRQRELGLAIHGELLEHQELLSELDTSVQGTRERMGRAETQMRDLERR